MFKDFRDFLFFEIHLIRSPLLYPAELWAQALWCLTLRVFLNFIFSQMPFKCRLLLFEFILPALPFQRRKEL